MNILKQDTSLTPNKFDWYPLHLSRKIIDGVYEFQMIDALPGKYHLILRESSSTRNITFFEEMFLDQGYRRIVLNFDYANRLFSCSNISSPMSAYMWKRHNKIYCSVNPYNINGSVIFELVPSDCSVICFHSSDTPLHEFMRRFNDQKDQEMQREIKLARDILVRNILSLGASEN